MSSKTRHWNQTDPQTQKSSLWPTVCFSGHRPDGLYGYNLSDPRYRSLTQRIAQVAMLMQERRNAQTFISGMALGVDQIAFQAMLNNKKGIPQMTVNLVAAVPFKDQATVWPEQSQETYRSLLQQADEVIEVDLLEKYQIPGTKRSR